jgi:hypothetical protein
MSKKHLQHYQMKLNQKFKADQLKAHKIRKVQEQH